MTGDTLCQAPMHYARIVSNLHLGYDIIHMAEYVTLTTNRKAFHNYFLEEKYEAGIMLLGTEIKSLRSGRVNMGDAYVKPQRGELWLVNAHISAYECSGHTSHEPMRERKLLMHRKEIALLMSKVKEKGLTLIPVRIYLKNDIAKVELSLGRGKKLYDKRDTITKRDTERELEREVKYRNFRR